MSHTNQRADETDEQAHNHDGHAFSFRPAGPYCETCDEYLSKQSNGAMKARENDK